MESDEPSAKKKLPDSLCPRGAEDDALRTGAGGSISFAVRPRRRIRAGREIELLVLPLAASAYQHPCRLAF